MELASMQIESTEDLKCVCAQISGFTKEQTPIRVGIRFNGVQVRLPVTNEDESKKARWLIGHLSKDFQVTVTISEEGER